MLPTESETIVENRDGNTEKTLSIESENSRWWCVHFRDNVDRQIAIEWEQGPRLSPAEIAILIPSLQDFQLGESSEGLHGRARATTYANRVGDEYYAKAKNLFFQEENRHASYLAKFIRQTGHDLIQKSWTDFVFRRIRRLMGLEMLIAVLGSAEIIGEVYYRAVRNGSRSELLRQICTQLLRDEKQHLRFHIERFRLIHARQSRFHTAFRTYTWRVFFAVTLLAVWSKHRRALAMGKRTLRLFWRESWSGWKKMIVAIEASKVGSRDAPSRMPAEK